MSQLPDLQALIDRAAIQDVLTRYFQGIDRSSPAQVRACFTDDVQCWYDGKPPTRGIEALMGSFWAFENQKSGAWKITTHFMGNLAFNALTRDQAETETNAIAFLVLTTDGPGDKVTMRSLRYLDRLRRVTGGWQICERQHTLDWSCQVPATFATTTAMRINARPSS